MPAATSDRPAEGDDLDNLLDYDGAVEDFWKDLPETNGGHANDTINEPEKDMDEEVKVTKKRKPNPKLDQERLLSDAGIPKLRRIARDKLKFKGKGHEFSDISRMLNLYQLWLDDLYPKAKFRDGLEMVEKLGHSKRLQVSRRAWIEESKNHRRREDDEADARMQDVAEAEDDTIFPVASEATQQNPTQQQTRGGGDAPDEDDLDALLREQDDTQPTINPVSNAPARAKGPFQEDDEPDEDELDALLNEDLRKTNIAPQEQPSKQKGPFEEDDQDELDMLLADEPQQSHSAESVNNKGTEKPNPTQGGKEADFADDEEAMAEMDW